MIFPVLFIEGDLSEEALSRVKFCIESSTVGCVNSLNMDSENELFDEQDATKEIDFHIKSSLGTMLEKWIISKKEGKFSIRLQRVFSMLGNYSEYRDLEMLADLIAESDEKLKIYFIEQGVKLITEEFSELHNRLSGHPSFNIAVFWD